MMNNDPDGRSRRSSRARRASTTAAGTTSTRGGAARARPARSSSTPTPSAGYPWQVVQTSLVGRAVRAARGRRARDRRSQAGLTEDAARAARRARRPGSRRAARGREKRDFQPVPLGVTLSICALRNDVQQQADRQRHRPCCPGSDPELATRRCSTPRTTTTSASARTPSRRRRDLQRRPRQRLRRGRGCSPSPRPIAALPSARAARSSSPPSAREEQGLLGSEYLAAHPPVPAGRIAATSTSTASTSGAARATSTMIGLGKSDLDDGRARRRRRARAAASWATSSPTGFFYRSDQFNFAKRRRARGLPRGRHGRHRQARGLGQGAAAKYEADRLPPAVRRAAAGLGLLAAWSRTPSSLFYLRARRSPTAELPSWNPGDEFEAARKNGARGVALAAST